LIARSLTAAINQKYHQNTLQKSIEYNEKNMLNKILKLHNKAPTNIPSLIAKHAKPLVNYDSILPCIGDGTQVVLIGEASHGTREFYQIRSEITKRLIQDKGYTIVAVEADWPDAYRVNQYVRSHIETGDKNAERSLQNFQRFPRWMWRNEVLVPFIEWLREHNAKINSPADEAGFYGLDLYSLNSSREEVLKYLNTVDPQLADQARKHYACFNRFSNDNGVYGLKTGLGFSTSCEKQVLQVLKDMLQKHALLMAHHNTTSEGKPGLWEQDQYFYAKHNAILVADAEVYYRNMYVQGANTWNIRDKHMCNTLMGLIEDLSDQSRVSKTQRKAVVWAHNSHIGDSFYTEVSDRGEYNIGQLARENFGLDRTFNIGFITHHGSVTAAHNWDEDPHHMKVRKGLDGSYEQLFHEALEVMRMENKDPKMNKFLLNFRSNNKSENTKDHVASQEVIDALERRRLQRMIGVLYKPETERSSHYMHCSIPKQFDSVIHIDRTHALEPLEVHPQWLEAAKRDLIPETYPTGM